MAATTIKQIPLERVKITKRFVSGMVGWLILSVIAVVALSFLVRLDFISSVVGLFVFLVLLVAWQWFYETKYFDAYFYDIAVDELDIRKGWITPRETILPYEKMQDVYVDQDIFDRMFGLWDVHVSTATMMSGMEAHIDGVKRENAMKLREMLLQKIRSKKARVTGYD